MLLYTQAENLREFIVDVVTKAWSIYDGQSDANAIFFEFWMVGIHSCEVEGTVL